MCGDASDCAPSVRANAACKSGDATGSNGNPATDPAGPATEADVVTKKTARVRLIGLGVRQAAL